MSNYQPVIGLEVHVELNTKSKMFCRCSADYFGKEPNTHVCPVCLGLPGALPYINEEAINKCMQIGLALGCTISKKSLFERKNYFYPDLPKGYQISQYRWPLCINGWIEVEGLEGNRRIRINRVHQEEDTGKLTHLGSETLIDFNRSGVPLVEIVTEPDFTSSEQVKDYAKKLQQIFRYLEVSNADMERGDMRLEANVSVRSTPLGRSQGSPSKWQQLPNYRVELKNINSFRFMVAAIEYEIKRQTEALEKGEKLTQETRGWNEDKKCTYIQRSKEEAHDYRYFPEPDLPELRIEESRVKSQESSLSELPDQKLERFQKEYGLTKAQSESLVDSMQMAQFFEEAAKIAKEKKLDPKTLANYLINRKPDLNVKPFELVDRITNQSASMITDEEKLEKLAKQAIKETPKAAADYQKGKEAALQVLVGGVMRLSSGKAGVGKVVNILKSLLSN